MNAFGEWLIKARCAKNLYAYELAQKVRLNPAAITGYVTGRFFPRYTTVVALCSVLGDDPDKVWKLVQKAKEKKA